MYVHTHVQCLYSEGSTCLCSTGSHSCPSGASPATVYVAGVLTRFLLVEVLFPGCTTPAGFGVSKMFFLLRYCPEKEVEC